MSDSARELLVRGIAAAKGKEYQEARFYLEWALRLEPPIPMRIEIWYWLSEISSDPVEKRNFIEDILANDPGDARARRKLAIIDGKLQPEKIIDPDRFNPKPNEEIRDGQIQRFTCPTCGGRMTYLPDGSSLTCEYCDSQQKITDSQARNSEIPEENFIVTMATARGHLETCQTRLNFCQGCGAKFFFTPAQMSGLCPYCDSAYIIEAENESDAILPNSLIPFENDEKQARQIFQTWLSKIESEQTPTKISGRGVYLPVWTFDIAGQLYWSAELRKNKNQWVPFTDQKIIYHNDVKVLATRHFPKSCEDNLDRFDLSALVPYDPRYLSAWLAESHHNTVGDASLVARKLILDLERKTIPTDYSSPIRNLNIRTSSVIIESYKLILLPVWLCHYWMGNSRYDVVINGQNGFVSGEFPAIKSTKGFLNLF